MGKGSPKRVDAIPTILLVNIYAAEGLLAEAFARANVLVKLIASGDEGKWEELNKARQDVYSYAQQYTRAVMALHKNQEKA